MTLPIPEEYPFESTTKVTGHRLLSLLNARRYGLRWDHLEAILVADGPGWACLAVNEGCSRSKSDCFNLMVFSYLNNVGKFFCKIIIEVAWGFGSSVHLATMTFCSQVPVLSLRPNHLSPVGSILGDGSANPRHLKEGRVYARKPTWLIGKLLLEISFISSGLRFLEE
jgi:hypothetical protein